MAPSKRPLLRASALSLALATCAVACGGASFPPVTTSIDARNEDPWLAGAPCAAGADTEGLRIEDVTEGIGKVVELGDTVRTHYAAALPGGATFRESRSSGAPIEVIVGGGTTFCGFDRSLPGMKAGGKRRVTIPARLAFGDVGRPPDVPTKSDVVVTIEVFWPAASSSERGSAPVNPIRGGGGRRR